MNWQYVFYAGGVAGIGFGSRAWAQYRKHRREQTSFNTPLIEEEQLALVFMPRAKDGDSADVLAEMHRTFTHLNRQTYAVEFWDLDKQLVTYYGKLPEPMRPTMRRALVRLITANDRWLQVVGAKTASVLLLPEAVPPLRAVIEIGDSLRPGDPEKDYGRQDQGSQRFFAEMESALTRLESRPDAKNARN